MSLAVIDKLVQEKADQMPEAVFGLLLDRAKHQHICFANHHPRTNECDCDYCSALRDYVTTKLTAHRFRKRFLYLDSYCPIEVSSAEVEARSTYLQAQVKEKRAIKNLAKT